MGKCNRCSYEAAKANLPMGQMTTLRRDEERGGFDLFTHPKNVKQPWLERDKYFSAWYMELSHKCAC